MKTLVLEHFGVPRRLAKQSVDDGAGWVEEWGDGSRTPWLFDDWHGLPNGVVIVGGTGAGKSLAALRLASRFLDNWRLSRDHPGAIPRLKWIDVPDALRRIMAEFRQEPVARVAFDQAVASADFVVLDNVFAGYELKQWEKDVVEGWLATLYDQGSYFVAVMNLPSHRVEDGSELSSLVRHRLSEVACSRLSECRWEHFSWSDRRPLIRAATR